MGHVGGRRFSVGELHAASKTSSANGSHLNVWGFDISAAEFPQPKKKEDILAGVQERDILTGGRDILVGVQLYEIFWWVCRLCADMEINPGSSSPLSM